MLEVINLSKKFLEGTNNEVVALEKVDFELDEGDFVSVIGSNGAGKTTFLNLIAGSTSPTTGRVVLEGVDMTGYSEHQRAAYIGRVFQEPGKGTAPGMTVAQNLSLALKKSGRGLRKGVTSDRKQRFQEELSKLGLGLEERLGERIRHLSGGQRQGLAVLMATFTTPKLLLLDEHTASLDPKNADKIIDITKKLVEEKGLTTIMVTHDMKQALKLGNRLTMLHRGNIVYDVNGEKKQSLTIDDLLQSFSERNIEDDELLLSIE